VEEFSRPATVEDLKDLVRRLNAEQAEYLLIGGYGLYANGLHRATDDIDLVVPATRESGEKLKKVLLALPDKAARDIDVKWFEQRENIRVSDAFVVDLMLSACGETYETLKPYAKIVDFDGVPLRTIDLEGLLLTKQSPRAKDVGDRAIIEKALELSRRKPPGS
jgi:hypothetical protein